jgi:quinol monooxygenase YgiN
MSPVRLVPRLLGVAALTVAALFAAHAGGQEKEHPIAAQVKASLKDPTKPFAMLVSLQVKEGTAEKFEAAFKKAIKPTRAEKGCLAYELSRDTKAPTQYLLYERWANLASLEAHLKAPHITTLLKELGELLAGPPDLRVLVPTAD